MNYENMLTLKSKISGFDAGSLLDVAVGRGEFLKFAMGAFRSWQSAAGLDFDADLLKTARKEFMGSPVLLIFSSALTMPFTDHYFDTITLSNAMHHIEKLQPLFAEFSRVCKAQGLIIINEMLNEDFSEMQETYMLYHRLIAEMDNQLGQYHREPYTLKEITALIKASNLKVQEQFTHSEITGDAMNVNEIQAMSDRLNKRVDRLRGTDFYYFYRNKAQDVIGRFNKTGIHRPRHVTFILRTS
jgi:ubiquinone/menaquinone biosynthesis C-methylase UbiE